MNIQVLVFMSEIKFNLTLKKKNQIFCFFYALLSIIKIQPTLQLSCQKTNIVSRHFVSIWSYSASLGV